MLAIVVGELMGLFYKLFLLILCIAVYLNRLAVVLKMAHKLNIFIDFFLSFFCVTIQVYFLWNIDWLYCYTLTRCMFECILNKLQTEVY